MTSVAGFGPIVRALKNPDYGRYTAGNAVSLVGTWMQRVAVGWLTWQITESGAWLGAMAFAELFPTVVIAPLAGAAADRWDRLRTFKLCQWLLLAQALALFALTATGAITIRLLLGLTLVLGVVAAFTQPNRLALVPSLVARADLPAALAINSIIFNSARFLGPALAGIVIVGGSIALAFALNAASFVWFLLLLRRIHSKTSAAGPSTMRGGLFAEIGEGLRYVLGHPGIGPLLLLLFAFALGARPFVELLPGFAGAVFGAGAEGLALMTSTVGLGAIVGGLWLAGRGHQRGLALIALSAPAVLALALLLFVASDRLWLAVPALFLAGGAMVTGGVGAQTLLQLAVDGALRGRVMAFYGLIFRGGPALGALAMGTASEAAGLRLPLAAGVLLACLAWIAVWRRRRRGSAALEVPQAGPAG